MWNGDNKWVVWKGTLEGAWNETSPAAGLELEAAFFGCRGVGVRAQDFPVKRCHPPPIPPWRFGCVTGTLEVKNPQVY